MIRSWDSSLIACPTAMLSVAYLLPMQQCIARVCRLHIKAENSKQNGGEKDALDFYMKIWTICFSLSNKSRLGETLRMAKAHKGQLYEHHLKRELGLFEATFYGVGIIIGAGIFVMLGSASGLAGNAVWLSFVLSALIAAFTGLSYCELSSRYPHESAEYLYTKQAFRSLSLSFIIGWLLIITAAFSAATVAVGFAGYFSALFSTPVAETAVMLLLLLSLVNFRGIKESARMSVIFALMEIGALVIVILISIPFLGSVNYFSTPSGSLPAGLGGVAAAAALVFFAYIGFDTIPKISDETRKPSKTIPKALVYSLVISTVLYILVSLSVVSVLPWEGLAASVAPLTDVTIAAAGPIWGSIISFLALVATLSTVLIILVAGSRTIYGMAKEGALPEYLAHVHPKRRTPYIAVFLIMVLSMVFVYTGNITTLASMTNVGMFIVFIFVNASLISVRFKAKNRSPFRVPLNIGRFPVLALFGLVTSAIFLLQFEPIIYTYQAAAIAAGLFMFKILHTGKKKHRII